MSGNIYAQNAWLGNENRVRAIEQRIHEYINTQRQNYNCYEYDLESQSFSDTPSDSRGRHTLTHNSYLRRIARQHSIYLCNNLNQIDSTLGATAETAHSGPNNEQVEDKVGDQITIIPSDLLAENIAFIGGDVSDFTDEDIVQNMVIGDPEATPRGGWLYSTSGHKENMLGCDHIRHGVGGAITENCIVAKDILSGPYSSS